MSKKLTWLHISDIHFHPENDWRDSPATVGLIDHLKNVLKKIPTLCPDLVFCTGDIAYGETDSSPLKEQYEKARTFFDELLAACGKDNTPLQKERLFVVPGNHDIRRDSGVSDTLTLLNLWAKDATNHVNEVNQRFHNKEIQFNNCIHRLGDYAKFIMDYLPHQNDSEGHHCYTTSIKINGLKIGIAGFNSAWSCAGPEKERDIWLPAESQFGAAQSVLDTAEVRIGLIHHPLEWLNNADRDVAKQRISGYFDFWLHGHSHDAWIEPSENKVIIAAGAVGAENDREFGINLVQVEIPTTKGTAHLYQHQRAERGWKPASVANHAPIGIWTFNLPKRLLESVSTAPAASTSQAPAKKPFDLWAQAYKKHLSAAHKTFEPKLFIYQKVSGILATTESRNDLEGGDNEDIESMMLHAYGNVAVHASSKPTAFEALRGNPRVIIQAGAGAGKTTSGLSFCLEQNTVAAGNEMQLTLYLNLHDYKETGLDSLLPRLESFQPKLSELPDDWDIHLILDALDECPYSLTSQCVKDILNLVSLRRDIHYVIITRPMRGGLGQFADWKHFKLDAFSREDREHYLEEKLAGWKPDQLNKLYEAINNQPGCEYLYANPFFLSIFAEIIEPQAVEVPRRLQMMDRYARRAVTREFNEKFPQWADHAEAIREQVFSILGKIAFAIGVNGQADADTLNLSSDQHSATLINILVKRSLILEKTPSDGIAFTHDLFKQFFLCLYLISNCGDINQLPHRQNGEWSVLLSFLLEYDHQDNLPRPIVEWAWHFDKLAVTFGLNNLEILKQLAIPDLLEDPWLRGLLKAGRGEDARHETDEISEKRLSSPSYALEQRLKDPALWYIGSLGNARNEYIADLIGNNMEPWGELMPAITEGNTDWREKLQGAPLLNFCLGLVDIRDQTEVDRLGNSALNEPSWFLALFISRCAKIGLDILKWNMHLIPHLEQISTRRLHRLFVSKAFRGVVEQNNESGDRLFDFTITHRKLIPELANIFPLKMVRKAVQPVQAEMLDMLSPVEMSLGVRKKLFNACDVSEAWINYWAPMVDPIEAHKLLDTGIFTADKIDEVKLTAWKDTLGAEEAAWLVRAKLFKGSDFNPQLIRRWLDESDRHNLFYLFTTRTITPEISAYPEFVEGAFARLPFGQCWLLVRKDIIPEVDIPESFWPRARQGKNSDPCAFAFLLAKGEVYANAIKEECKNNAIKSGSPGIRAFLLQKEALTLEECWEYESASIAEIEEKITESIRLNRVDTSNFEINRGLHGRSFTFVVIRKCASSDSFYAYHPFWNCDVRFSIESGIPCDKIQVGSVIQSFVNVAFLKDKGVIDFRVKAKSKWDTGKNYSDSIELIIIHGNNREKLRELRSGNLDYAEVQQKEGEAGATILPLDINQFQDIDTPANEVQDINYQLKNMWFTLHVVETKPDRKTGLAAHPYLKDRVNFSFDNIIEEREVSDKDWIFCKVRIQKKSSGRKWRFCVRDGAFLLRCSKSN